MLQPHQERVVQEKTELDDKISRLDPFVQSSKFDALPDAEKSRMERQLSVMREYSQILGGRIEAFTA